MIALLLAAVLAQVSPSPEPSASATASSSSAPVTAPAPETGGIVRRMPNRAPNVAPVDVNPTDVVIRNSGSTNTAGYVIVVHPDYSVDVGMNGSTNHKTLAEAQGKWLFDLMKADTPLAGIAGGHCMKSASFGSYTTISYNGESSGDLSCGRGSEAMQELNRTIAVIMQQLQIDTRPGHLRRLL